MVTRIAILGGGRAATLHAQTATALPGIELVGVGGRPGSATDLAAAAGVADLSLADLIRQSCGSDGADPGGGVIVAVSPEATAAAVAAIPPAVPLLVESPVRLPQTDHHETAPRMTAVNLLHAPMVKKGLRAITEMGDVHHLTMRGRAVPRRDTDPSGILAVPFAGAWPVLMAAAGSASVAVSAVIDDSASRVDVSLELADGRTATASVDWIEAAAGSARTEIEAASATGVASIGLWPTPSLELDGRAVAGSDDHPLVSLGFVEQLRRFATVCDNRADPWPPLSVGLGVVRLIDAAMSSAERGGAITPI